MNNSIRTSYSDPIQINWIEIGTGWGQIGMTLCPGKKQPDGISGLWDRNPEVDLSDIRQWGAKHVVSLLGDNELSDLKVPDLGQRIQSQGMTWHHFPIEDRGVPDQAGTTAWAPLTRDILDALSKGENVLIHCKGGLGRTGSFVAALLAANGVEPYKAIGKIRESRPGSIETSKQEKWVHETAVSEGVLKGAPAEIGVWSTADSNPTLLDRFRGCMLGGAVGDALGAPVEFLTTKSQIHSQFGPDGIKEYADSFGRLGAITDDTQMTMFTAEGCIRSYTRFYDRGLCSPRDVIAWAYRRGLLTQGGSPTDGFNKATYLRNGWLFDIPELHTLRAPGLTCIGALESDQPVEDSKGCGGVMRVAPVGLLGATKTFNDSVYELGLECAAITHGHPTGYIAAGAFAEIIFELTSGSSIEDSCNKVLRDLSSIPDAQETIASLESALKLAKKGVPPEESIKQLSLVDPSGGGGWCAEEALAIGVFAALVAKSFSDGIRIAVNHIGDSDSTGSIAGQILGTNLGIQAIGSEWLDELELRDEIDVLTHDLYSLSNGGKGASMPRSWEEKYPPN